MELVWRVNLGFKKDFKFSFRLEMEEETVWDLKSIPEISIEGKQTPEQLIRLKDSNNSEDW